jgi:hypothetical protein
VFPNLKLNISFGRASTNQGGMAMVHRLLSDDHRRRLESESAISPSIIDEMGAWSATTKAELSDIGFRLPSIRPPALVLPVLTWADVETQVYSRIRPDKPRTDRKGKPCKYEQPAGQPCRIYCLPSARKLIEGLQGISGRPLPKLNYIFVTEGEKKAAAAVSKGLAALGVSGVWNFKNLDALRGDWDLIRVKGLNVCIAFDSDAATNEQVLKAEDRLADLLRAMGAKVFVCRFPEGINGEKTGADDFFARGGTVEELANLIDEHYAETSSAKPSTAVGLIELGEQRAKFWHDGRREAFATVPLASGGFENLPVRGSRFREWLGGEWYRRGKGCPPREAMERAIETLVAQAIHDGAQRETAKRIGHTEGAVWVDLCDDRRSIVRVTAEGWEFVADNVCELRFLRPETMRAMPEPTNGCTLSGLRELLSVNADGLMAIEAYLLGAFMPSPGGFPILTVTGEQGSGKSFGCRIIREVLDPSALALRRAPKDDGDLSASLNSGYLLAFDNLSKVSGWLSDTLCSLATGGGIARRQLYTNADEHVVTGRRPVLLNGINDVVTAPDLAERCLFVEFIRPADVDRLTESKLEERWKQVRGSILGALLDRVSRALRDRGTVTPGALPRLADFAEWVYAGTPEAERAKVWRTLAENRKAKNLSTIEDHPLASAVWVLANQGGFEGTACNLLSRLNAQEEYNGRSNRVEGWPASPDALGKQLRRLIPVFEAVGIEVRQSRGRERIWRIFPRKSEQASKVPEVTGEPLLEPRATTKGFDTCNMESNASVSEVSPGNFGSLYLNLPDRDTCDTSDTGSGFLTSERGISGINRL